MVTLLGQSFEYCTLTLIYTDDIDLWHVIFAWMNASRSETSLG